MSASIISYDPGPGQDCGRTMAGGQSDRRSKEYHRMWSLSDEALLAGLASGDQASGVAFIRRFQRQMYGLALAILGDSGGAEDVAQEAFVRVWRHAQAYDARRGSVQTWVLAITRNLAIDALRVRKPEPVSPDALWAMHLPDGGDEPDEAAVIADEVARVRAALMTLPDEQRRAVVLAAFFGRTAREVGDTEDIPLGTAKTRIRTALLKLRAALAGAEEDAE
jgi:RNA polymerase sigma factor (sigma-70 family)